jgi:hypothetical protein
MAEDGKKPKKWTNIGFGWVLGMITAAIIKYVGENIP